MEKEGCCQYIVEPPLFILRALYVPLYLELQVERDRLSLLARKLNFS